MPFCVYLCMMGGPTFLKVGESHTFVTLALSSAEEAELPPPPFPHTHRTGTNRKLFRPNRSTHEGGGGRGGRKSSLPLLCSSGRLSTEGGGGEETLQKEVVESDTKGRSLHLTHHHYCTAIAEWAPESSSLGYDLARSFMVREREGALFPRFFPPTPRSRK